MVWGFWLAVRIKQGSKVTLVNYDSEGSLNKANDSWGSVANYISDKSGVIKNEDNFYLIKRESVFFNAICSVVLIF